MKRRNFLSLAALLPFGGLLRQVKGTERKRSIRASKLGELVVKPDEHVLLRPTDDGRYRVVYKSWEAKPKDLMWECHDFTVKNMLNKNDGLPRSKGWTKCYSACFIDECFCGFRGVWICFFGLANSRMFEEGMSLDTARFDRKDSIEAVRSMHSRITWEGTNLVIDLHRVIL